MKTKNSTQLLSEVLQQRLIKSPALEAKQRRLLALLQAQRQPVEEIHLNPAGPLDPFSAELELRRRRE